MKLLLFDSILNRIKGRSIVGLSYDVKHGYLRIELDDGSVLIVAASWEGAHLVVDSCSASGQASISPNSPL